MTTLDYIFTTGIPTIAVIIVGFILKNQLNSQEKILNSYQEYIKTVDWQEVRKYYDEFVIPSRLSKLEKAITDILTKETSEINKIIDEQKAQHKEIFKLLIYLLVMKCSKAEAKDLINDIKMPTTAHLFEGIWALYDQQIHDIQ